MSRHRKLSTSLMGIDPTKPSPRLSVAAISEQGDESEEGQSSSRLKTGTLHTDSLGRTSCSHLTMCACSALDFVYLEEEDELRVDAVQAVRV
jgi:hypothetical protein